MCDYLFWCLRRKNFCIYVSFWIILQCGDFGLDKRENGENNYVYNCQEKVFMDRKMRVEEKDFQGVKDIKRSRDRRKRLF